MSTHAQLAPIEHASAAVMEQLYDNCYKRRLDALEAAYRRLDRSELAEICTGVIVELGRSGLHTSYTSTTESQFVIRCDQRAKDAMRKRKRRHELAPMTSSDAAGEDAFVAQADGLSELIERQASASRTKEMLLGLKPKEQVFWFLFHHQGLERDVASSRVGFSRAYGEKVLTKINKQMTAYYTRLENGEICVEMRTIVEARLREGGRSALREDPSIRLHMGHCSTCPDRLLAMERDMAEIAPLFLITAASGGPLAGLLFGSGAAAGGAAAALGAGSMAAGGGGAAAAAGGGASGVKALVAVCAVCVTGGAAVVVEQVERSEQAPAAGPRASAGGGVSRETLRARPIGYALPMASASSVAPSPGVVRPTSSRVASGRAQASTKTVRAPRQRTVRAASTKQADRSFGVSQPSGGTARSASTSSSSAPVPTGTRAPAAPPPPSASAAASEQSFGLGSGGSGAAPASAAPAPTAGGGSSGAASTCSPDVLGC